LKTDLGSRSRMSMINSFMDMITRERRGRGL
jgi:hypothetical protein